MNGSRAMNRAARGVASGPHPGLLPGGEGEIAHRGFQRDGPGVRWNGWGRLARMGFRHVACRGTRLPLPPGEGRGEGSPFQPSRPLHVALPVQKNLPASHEPMSRGSRKRPSSRPSPRGRRRMLNAGFRGMGQVFAGTDGDGSHEWDSGTSPAGVRDSLSLRERTGVREARFNPRDRFM